MYSSRMKNLVSLIRVHMGDKSWMKPLHLAIQKSKLELYLNTPPSQRKSLVLFEYIITISLLQHLAYDILHDLPSSGSLTYACMCLHCIRHLIETLISNLENFTERPVPRASLVPPCTAARATPKAHSSSRRTASCTICRAG